MADALTTDAANVVVADQGMMYWRAPDGRIFAATQDERDYARKIRRGYIPLEKYGFYSSSAYYMDHPHEPLFQAGGAVEMKVEDLLALGYAQRPPLVPVCGQHVGTSKDHLQHRSACWSGARPVHFPQLDGMNIPELLECEYCGRDDLATNAALKQHQEVMHTERRQEEGLSQAIIEGLQQGGALSGGGSAEAIAAAVTATLQALGMIGSKSAPAPAPDPAQDPPSASPKTSRPYRRRRTAFPALGDLDVDDFKEAFPTHGTTLNLATGRLGPHRPESVEPLDEE